MLSKIINRMKDNGKIDNEMQKKIDVLFLAGRVSEKDYLKTVNKAVHHIKKIDDKTFEIVKDEEVTINDGKDYIRPITFVKGMTVSKGLWYTDGDNVWEAIKNGVPAGFDDTKYFDIIK